MFHVIARPRRIVMAASVAALLGVAAMLSVSTAPASAEFHRCPTSEFCLYFNEDANGGLYHFEGSDANLNNDRYERADTGETVGDTSRYVTNNGSGTSLSDVIVYGLPGYRGARDCIQKGDSGELPRNWWNNIESYRWVTHSQCKKAGVLLFD